MVKDFEQEIANHKKAIEDLLAEKEAFEKKTPDQRLAIALHDALCRWNHTDGCGWFYEVYKDVDDWTGHAHARWLENANKVRGLLPGMDGETIVRVSRAIKNLS